jgi:hypothetical protein
VAGDDSCVTVDALNETGGYRNATVGSALPRLFTESWANFSIPLNSSKILDLFSSGDMSCTSENALVTFNGANRKRHHSSKALHRHHDELFIRAPVGAEPSQTHTFPQPSSNTPSSSSGSPPSPTASPPAKHTLSSRTLDFSRIAVLFVLEQTGLIGSATNAHDLIQAFLNRGTDNSGTSQPMGVSAVKQNFTLDFVKFTITMDNGTVVGGK